MTRHKRGQNKNQQHKSKTRYDVSETMPKKNFVDAYYTTTPLVDHMSKDRYSGRRQLLPYYDYLKDTTTKINSNASLKQASLRGEDNSIAVKADKSFRPKTQNNSIIDGPSSIAELVMKGEIDNPLARVTTARPTIIIYPTGKCINFTNFIINKTFKILDRAL